ncbi:MAG: metalloregulator ArsR/SmtB family transcription factor [Burkholderiales bacterium]|jgi:ArsR family transcriptional regulator|nr:metalloregulator ArsR/SmtB family transcription factor [Burkholderiales bacterium]
MTQPSDAVTDHAEKGRVFELAAELFGVLATPMRLRILSALCDQEKSVSQLLSEIETTQPNLSQHLNVLYRTGVLAKRKEGTQVIYRVQSEQAVSLCRTVCTQIAIEMDEPGSIPAAQRLSPRLAG